MILHSRADDVVPFADSEELVKNSGLLPWTLIEVGNDHRLADPESLETMLLACADPDEEDEATEYGDEDSLLRDWSGLCYTAALKWASTKQNEKWLVVHGTLYSHEEEKRIDHAWCECGEKVVDLTMPVEARMIERAKYYSFLEVQVSRRYSADDALLLSFKNRHDGPWTEAEQLADQQSRSSDLDNPA